MTKFTDPSIRLAEVDPDFILPIQKPGGAPGGVTPDVLLQGAGGLFAMQDMARGGGGVARAVTDRLRETPSERDYAGSTQTGRIAAAMAALSEAGGGVLRVPAGVQDFAFQLPPTNVLLDIDGPMINRSQLGGGGTVNFRRAMFGRIAGGRNNNTRTSLYNVTALAEGSGQNGIANGDVAMEIRIDKENWSNPGLAQPGEIDGLFVYSRQGGPITGVKSALGGAVIDVGMTKGTGFLCAYEMVSTVFDQDNGMAAIYQIDLQSAVLNSRDGDYYGYIFNAQRGTMGAALLIKNDLTNGSSWGRILQNAHNGVTNFWMTVAGEVVFNPLATTATRIKLANSIGAFEVRNNADAALFAVGQDGALLSAATPWASTETIFPNDVRTSGGNTYRCVEIGGTATVAPTHTAGVVTGADGVRWMWERADALAPFGVIANGALAVPRLRLVSAQGSRPHLGVVATPGSPNGQITEALGSLAVRSDGGYGRSLYVKETAGGNTGWTEVVSASRETGIAATGTTQATAAALSRRTSSVSTGAAGTGVMLSAVLPDEQMVFNRNVNAVLVYPPVGGEIDSLGTNAPVTIAPGGWARFVARGSSGFYRAGQSA